MICPIIEKECARFTKEHAGMRKSLAAVCLEAQSDMPDVSVYDCPAEAAFVDFAAIADGLLGEL